MTRTIRARFSKGVFEPLDPTPAELINEGEEVTLTIDTGPSSSGDPLHETAGGWRGLIDAEAFKEAVYRDRLLVTRPPASSLWTSTQPPAVGTWLPCKGERLIGAAHGGALGGQRRPAGLEHQQERRLGPGVEPRHRDVERKRSASAVPIRQGPTRSAWPMGPSAGLRTGDRAQPAAPLTAALRGRPRGHGADVEAPRRPSRRFGSAEGR
jgi:Protein of unknown function DUF104